MWPGLKKYKNANMVNFEKYRKTLSQRLHFVLHLGSRNIVANLVLFDEIGVNMIDVDLVLIQWDCFNEIFFLFSKLHH